MSITVNFTEASALAVSVFENDDVAAEAVPDVYGADTVWQQDVLRLVLEDAGNCYGFVIDGTADGLLKLAADIVAHVAAKAGAGDLLPPFFTVSQRKGTEGTEYVFTLTDNGESLSVWDGDDDYWTIANLIDKKFPEA